MLMRKIGAFAAALASRLARWVPAIWPAAAPSSPSGALARIHLYGLKARPLVMVMHTAQGVRSFVNVDGGCAADLRDTLAAQGQARPGLARTAGSCAAKPRKRIFSKVCYWEFLIPGGRPLQIGSASGGVCGASPMALARGPGAGRRSTDAVSFTPQCAKDYQVDIHTNEGVCTVSVHEVKTSAGATELLPIALD